MNSRNVAMVALLTLCLLQLAWHGWPIPDSAAAWLWLTIALVPLAASLIGALLRWPNALFWGALFSLAYFCHGVLEAWLYPQWRFFGILEASIASVLVLAAAQFGLQRRKASRRAAQHARDL